jgi:hypothetical protein
VTRQKISRARERRIEQQIVVDAYGPAERALGWYYYLEHQLRFPFAATCARRRPTSPLRVGEAVNILRLAPEDDCMSEIMVLTNWNRRSLGVPLAQLTPQHPDPKTAEAIADWHYWRSQGYQF